MRPRRQGALCWRQTPDGRGAGAAVLLSTFEQMDSEGQLPQREDHALLARQRCGPRSLFRNAMGPFMPVIRSAVQFNPLGAATASSLASATDLRLSAIQRKSSFHVGFVEKLSAAGAPAPPAEQETMNGRKRKTKGSSVKDSIARVLQKKPHGQQQEQQQRQKMTQNKKKGMGASKVVVVEVINGEAPQPRKYRKSITVKQFLHLRFRHRPEVLLAHWHFVFTSPDGFYARTVLQNQQRYYPGWRKPRWSRAGVTLRTRR